jgi:hypothetical protein
MDTDLYTRHGKHWGYIKDDYVFKNPHQFIGYMDDDEVYLKNGNFLGYLEDGKYILRYKNERSHKLKPIKDFVRIPKITKHPDPIPLIPNETFLKADELDCLEEI